MPANINTYTANKGEENEFEANYGITVTLKDNVTKEINKIQRKARNHGFYVDPLFDDIKRNIESAMTSFSLEIGREAYESMKSKVPYDNSPSREYDKKSSDIKEHLRDHITKKMKYKGKYTVEIFVGWERQYRKLAHLVNEGAEGHMINPKNKRSLQIPDPTSPQGSRGTDGFFYIRDGIFHPGFDGRHFLDITMQEMDFIVDRRLKNVFDAASGFSQ